MVSLSKSHLVVFFMVSVFIGLCFNPIQSVTIGSNSEICHSQSIECNLNEGGISEVIRTKNTENNYRDFKDDLPQIIVNYTYGGSHNDLGFWGIETENGDYDLCLIKTNVTGLGEINESGKWNKTFGGAYLDRGFCVQQTDDDMDGISDDGFIIVGRKGYNGYSNFWILKTLVNGSLDWSHSYGDGNYHCNEGHFVSQTTDYGYVASGSKKWSDSGQPKGNDVWLFKFDMGGAKEWDKAFGGTGEDKGPCVIQSASSNNYLVAGYTESYGSGSRDAYLLNTDLNGNLNWSRTYGGINFDGTSSIKQTLDGGYILTGLTNSFGAGSYDCWVIKTDINGTILWNNTFGGINDDRGRCIELANDGYLIAGYTTSDDNDYDGWILKINLTGQLVWEMKLGGSSDDYFRSITKSSDGGYVICGHTESFGQGEADIWLIKLDGNRKPLVNFTWSPESPYEGTELFFMDLSNDSDGTITEWNWDFGDENTSALRHPTHRYTSPGNYTVCLNVTDDDGAFDSISKIITIRNNTPPFILETYPLNNSIDISRPLSEFNVSVSDIDGDNMSLYFRWINHMPIEDKWDNLTEWVDVSNGTYAFTPPSSNDWIWGNTTYTWSVNVTDGTFWTNETYFYTTGGSRYDVNNNGVVNFQDAGLVWIHRTSEVDYDGIYDVNQNGVVNFQDAGLTWVNRD